MTNEKGSAGLLGHAAAVLTGQHHVPRNQASRAAALLARQALEDVVCGLCDAWGITDSRVNMRSRLIMMRYLGDGAAADLAATAWWGLSGACHHHAYELTPTPDEIQNLIDQVTRLAALSANTVRGGDGS